MDELICLLEQITKNKTLIDNIYTYVQDIILSGTIETYYLDHDHFFYKVPK